MTAAGAPPAAASDTPRADAVLHNPLATPAGVAAWLRARERALGAARAAAERARRDAEGAGQPVGELLVQATADLARALDDQENGALPRLLRRPLRQLAPGSTAAASFDRLTEQLIARAEQAVRVQPLVARAGERLTAVQAEYGARFPHLLRRELDDAGVDRGAIGRLRLTADAELLLDRLARADERMRAWAGEVANDATWDEVERTPGEPLTGAELGALVRRGLARRARLVAARDPAAGLRARLARHAAEARRRADRAAAPDDLAPVVRDLLLTAARLGEANAMGGADAPLWSWALNGAAPGHAAVWGAGDLTGAPGNEAAPPPAAATTLYVVPLGDLSAPGAEHRERGTLVWITPDTSSAVRVWDANVRLGATVEGRVALSTAAATDPVLERDLAALFDDADAPRSAWYTTHARARLEVVARHGDGWVARLTRRGELHATPAPAWDAQAGAPTEFRLLRPLPPRPRGAAVEVVHVLGEAGHTFGGTSTLEVRTGLAGDGRAWLRAPVPNDPAGPAVLARERALFEELARGAPPSPIALTPIGVARRGPVGEPLPLYRRPLATGPGLGELAPAWLRSDTARTALIAAIARVLVAVHEVGAALGAVHPDAFAYTLGYAPGGAALTPRALLAYAPCATPIGQRYDGATIRAMEARDDGLRLPRLRVSGAADEARAGGEATRAADAAAFLRCALDLLALATLPAAAFGGATRVAPVVAAHRGHFAAPDFARHVADVLDGGDAATMVRVLDVIGAERREAAGDAEDPRS